MNDEMPTQQNDKTSPQHVAALEAEVEQLRVELNTGGSRSRSWRSAWRPLVSGLLLVVVVLLAPVTVLARWTHAEVGDTDKYVETVAPLAQNPDVQAAIAHRITTIIFTYVDVSEVTEEAADALADRGLSDRAVAGIKALSGPLDGAVQSFVEARVLAIVQTDAFEQAWVTANREAHSQMVATLTGETDGSVTVSDGTVTVNLAALIDTVKETLVAQGFDLAAQIPSVDAEFVIFSSSDIGRVQKGFELLDVIATVLPILTLLLVAVAILVARSRRVTAIAGALCMAGGMVLLGLLLAVLRPLYLDALPESSSQLAGAAVYDALVSPMRRNLRIVLVLALVLAVVVWLAGPSSSAARIRSGARASSRFVRDRSRKRIDTGELGYALSDLRTPIRVGILAVGVVTLLWSLPLSAGRVTWTIVLMAAALAVLELLATPRPEPAPTTPAQSLSGTP